MPEIAAERSRTRLAQPLGRRTTFAQFASRYGMLAIFGVLVAALLVASPTFREPANLVNVLQQNSIIGIVSCGMLLMIIVGGFDLSVGAVGALSSCVAAGIIINTSIPLGIVGGLAVAGAVGVVNGTLIAKIGINPFVTTLGTQVLAYGLLYVATNAQPIYGLPTEFTWFGLGRIGPVPVAALIFALVIAATFAILRFTAYGHHVFAVGGNKEAARLAGINVDRVTIATYAIGGLFAGVAGLVLLGQTNIGQPASASAWPLAAIAAVVVGGVPLTGGVGGVGGAVLGTLLLGTVANAVKEANTAGIPVIAANNKVGEGAELVTFVGADDYQFGQKQGEMLVKAVGENANVGYIMGKLGTSAQLLRKQGLDDYLKNHPGIKLIESQSADWDNSKALALTQDWLNKYPAGKIDAIIDQGPEGATAAKWASENGRTDVKFMMGDYPKDVRDGIVAGYIYGTVDQDPLPQGVEAVRMAVYWLNGEKDKVPQPNYYLDLPIVTKDNVDQYAPAWGG